MAWTAPYTWTTGHLVTAAELNAQLKNNMRYLKGIDGAATFEDDLTVDNLITAGNVDGVDVGDHAANTTTAHGAVSAATASKFVVRDASARAKFAAPNASGDALIKGTRVTTAELPAMVDEKYWVGTGTNVEERDVPVAGATITSGTYTGNATANRAIAHGLGKVPKSVVIFPLQAYHEHHQANEQGYITYHGANPYAVTAPTTTNFYVGNATSYLGSGNQTAYTYHWAAVG